MKILCLNPPFKTEHGRFSRTSRSPAITKSGTVYYPIWLCYVAGVLEDEGHEVKVIDSCASEYDLDQTMEITQAFKPDIAVLDTSTPSILSDVKTGADIKEMLPDCFVVLMGTHPSALPEETLSLNAGIDAVAVGEADYIIRDLAEALLKADHRKLQSESLYRDGVLSAVKGIAYRYDTHIKVNERRELVKDLDEIPFVSRVYKKHLDVKKYFFAASDYPEVQIMTSRGCIARCTFCVYPQTIHQKKYRMRSPENIVDEFEWITGNLPEVREVGIEDDTFTGSQKRVIEFCRQKIERRIKLKWYCNVRIDLKLETMTWMRKANCVLVTVGYESANDGILKSINKKISSDMIVEFSRNTRKAGLMVHSCFMAGNRGETRETLNESLELALKITDDTMQFFPLMVYPGTEDYDWFREHKLLTFKKYSDYVTEDGCHNSVARMEDMDSEEIRKWCDFARRNYYLRARYIWYKLVQQIRRPSEIRRTIKAARRFIVFLVNKK
ncbi:B12-binding domain-containing radical SAM protein [Fibrobacterota bacterium]